MRGWILDLYPNRRGEMVVWLKGERAVRLVDRWVPSIFVSGSKESLKLLEQILATSRDVIVCESVERYVSPQDAVKSSVLRVSTFNTRRLAEEILRIGRYRNYRVYNVGVPSAQMYLYEKDLFPLAYVEAEQRGGVVSWELEDSVESYEYELPPLKSMRLSLEVDSSTRIPSLRDPLRRITLEIGDWREAVESGREEDKLLWLVEAVGREDPDILVTEGGNAFLLPYLARRALVNAVSERFILDRERTPLRARCGRGEVYFSYGRIYNRPAPVRLLGRIHLDEESSFLYSGCGLEGLVEIARSCRVPLQRVADTTIGTSMTSAQLYQATKDGVLIPWKKMEPENFKTAQELLVADRGGFYFEPKMGVHDCVGELDFASMYPTLMVKKNISPETVGCRCCPDSLERVPELGYNICQRRRGIVPKTLESLLRKRRAYKRLRGEVADPLLRRRYEQRQAALKWILVCSFGYLGFRNARFGKVDAHIATCAYAREALLNAAHLAEERGFEVLHGIVDSLWLKRCGAGEGDFVGICREIEDRLGLPISFEGLYRWIVFLPSRMHPEIPVLSRYYGVFTDGRIKVRGLELRRCDAPVFIQRCQEEMVRVLAEAKDAREFQRLIPKALEVAKSYEERLVLREVSPSDLVIVKQLSRDPDEYAHNVLQAVAARRLVREGVNVSAGQMVGYLMVDVERGRVLPSDLVEESTKYDVAKYRELIWRAASNLFPHLNRGS